MQLNIQFDAKALAAPQSFRNTILAAANLLGATITDAITVNIAVGYDDVPGSTSTFPTTGAEGGPLGGAIYAYSGVQTLLAGSLDPAVQSGVQALPITGTVQNQAFVEIWSAERKALGLLNPNASALDGAAGFGSQINSNQLLGVALHELTHAMGRVVGVPATVYGQTLSLPDILDLFRYSSPGVHVFGNVFGGYFSLDGGVTDLADYAPVSDDSDFSNSSIHNSQTDPFDEAYTGATQQVLTTLDKLQLEALGFHLVPVTPAFSAAPDIFWQNPQNGMNAVWELNGVGAATGLNLPTAANWQVDDVGDFNGDGLAADLVLRNTTTGMVDIWTDAKGHMSGADVTQATLDWTVMGAADFNGDGKSDILWRNEQSGYVSVWLMNGHQVQATWNPGQVGLEWHIVGAGDYSGDGRADILWRNANTGEVDLWTMDPTTGLANGAKVATVGLEWQVIGQGDFNGDGKTDVLWRDANTGQILVWDMNGAQIQSSGAVANLGAQWQVAGVLDINGDGKSDLVWRDTGSNQVVAWTMNDSAVTATGVVGAVDAGWLPLNHHFDWI